MTKRQDWLPQNHHSFESHVREALNHLNGGGQDLEFETWVLRYLNTQIFVS